MSASPNDAAAPAVGELNAGEVPFVPRAAFGLRMLGGSIATVPRTIAAARATFEDRIRGARIRGRQHGRSWR